MVMHHHHGALVGYFVKQFSYAVYFAEDILLILQCVILQGNGKGNVVGLVDQLTVDIYRIGIFIVAGGRLVGVWLQQFGVNGLCGHFFKIQVDDNVPDDTVDGIAVYGDVGQVVVTVENGFFIKQIRRIGDDRFGAFVLQRVEIGRVFIVQTVVCGIEQEYLYLILVERAVQVLRFKMLVQRLARLRRRFVNVSLQ